MYDELETEREAAGIWHARLRSQEAADHGAFADWLAASPRNRLAYADVCAAALALEQAAAEYGVDQHFIEQGRIEQSAPVRARSGRLGWVAGLAAALVAAIGVSQGASPWQNAFADVHTDVAEPRWLNLEDGSRVFLDADSAIDIDYTSDARNLKLVRGAALFEVEKDPARPFVVSAGDVRAEALGTQYTVERDPTGVRVDVREGVVGVRNDGGEATRVEAGHTVTVETGAQPGAVGTTDANTFAWTEQRLVFSGTPLPVALARLDRHLPGKLVLWGDAKNLKVTAAIPAADARQGLEALVREQGLGLTDVPGYGLIVHD